MLFNQRVNIDIDSKKCFKSNRYLACGVAVSALFSLGIFPVVAAPVGGIVAAGSATISQSPSGELTTIHQSSDRAVIEWQSFNLGKNETAEFQVPNTTSATLNLISDSNPSLLSGTVRSNGKLYFVNPNGLVFDASSRVMANGFVATSGTISNLGFMNSSELLPSRGAGLVTLDGAISAATITVLGDRVTVDGSLRGEKILVSSTRQTEIGQTAMITTHENNATITIWSDHHTDFIGTIIAPLGQVEVSGMETLNFLGTVTTRTADGRMGNLLLDPAKIEIVETAGIDATVTYITIARLKTALNGNHVTIDATNKSAINLAGQVFLNNSEGSITIKNGFDTTSNAYNGDLTLTTNAFKTDGTTIKLKGNLTISSPGGDQVHGFQAAQEFANSTLSATGSIKLTNQTAGQDSGFIFTNSTLTSGGDFTVLSTPTIRFTAIKLVNTSLVAKNNLSLKVQGVFGNYAIYLAQSVLTAGINLSFLVTGLRDGGSTILAIVPAIVFESLNSGTATSFVPNRLSSGSDPSNWIIIKSSSATGIGLFSQNNDAASLTPVVLEINSHNLRLDFATNSTHGIGTAYKTTAGRSEINALNTRVFYSGVLDTVDYSPAEAATSGLTSSAALKFNLGDRGSLTHVIDLRSSDSKKDIDNDTTLASLGTFATTTNINLSNSTIGKGVAYGGIVEIKGLTTGAAAGLSYIEGAAVGFTTAASSFNGSLMVVASGGKRFSFDTGTTDQAAIYVGKTLSVPNGSGQSFDLSLINLENADSIPIYNIQGEGVLIDSAVQLTAGRDIVIGQYGNEVLYGIDVNRSTITAGGTIYLSQTNDSESENYNTDTGVNLDGATLSAAQDIQITQLGGKVVVFGLQISDGTMTAGGNITIEQRGLVGSNTKAIQLTSSSSGTGLVLTAGGKTSNWVKFITNNSNLFLTTESTVRITNAKVLIDLGTGNNSLIKSTNSSGTISAIDLDLFYRGSSSGHSATISLGANGGGNLLGRFFTTNFKTGGTQLDVADIPTSAIPLGLTVTQAAATGVALVYDGAVTLDGVTSSGTNGVFIFAKAITVSGAASRFAGRLILENTDNRANLSLGADLSTSGGLTINSNGGNLVLTKNVTTSGGAVSLNLGAGIYSQDSVHGFILTTSGQNLSLNSGGLIRKSGAGVVIFRLGSTGELTASGTILKAIQQSSKPQNFSAGVQLAVTDKTAFDAATAYYFTSDSDSALAADKTTVGGTGNFWLPVAALNGIATVTETPTIVTTAAGLGFRFTAGDYGWEESGTLTAQSVVTEFSLKTSLPATLFNVRTPTLPTLMPDFAELHFAGSNSLGATTLTNSHGVYFDPSSGTVFWGEVLLKTPKIEFNGEVSANNFNFTVNSENSVLHYQGVVAKAAQLWFKGKGIKMTGATRLDGQDLYIDIGTATADFGGDPDNGGYLFDQSNRIVSLETESGDIYYHGGKLINGTIEFTNRRGQADDFSVFYSTNFFSGDKTLATNDIPSQPDDEKFIYSNVGSDLSFFRVAVLVDGLATISGIVYSNSDNLLILAKGITVTGTTASQFNGSLTLVNSDSDRSINIMSGSGLRARKDLNLISRSGNITVSETLSANNKINLDSFGGNISLGASLTTGGGTITITAGNGMLSLTADIVTSGGEVTLAFDEQGSYKNIIGTDSNSAGYSWRTNNRSLDLQTRNLTLGTGVVFDVGGANLTHRLPRTFEFAEGKNYYFTSDSSLNKNNIVAITGDNLAEIHGIADLNDAARGPRFLELSGAGTGKFSYNANFPSIPEPGSKIIFWGVNRVRVTADLKFYSVFFGGNRNSFLGTVDLSKNTKVTTIQKGSLLQGSLLLGSAGLVIEDGARLQGGVISSDGYDLNLSMSGNFRQGASDSRFDAGDRSLVISSSASGMISLLRVDNRFSAISFLAPASSLMIVSRQSLNFSALNASSVSLKSSGNIIAKTVQAGAIDFSALGNVLIVGNYASATGTAAWISLTNSSAAFVMGPASSDQSISIDGTGAVILTDIVSATEAVTINQRITIVGDAAITTKNGTIGLKKPVEGNINSSANSSAINSATANGISSANRNSLRLDAGRVGTVEIGESMGLVNRLGWVEISAGKFISTGIQIRTMDSTYWITDRDLGPNRRWRNGASF